MFFFSYLKLALVCTALSGAVGAGGALHQGQDVWKWGAASAAIGFVFWLLLRARPTAVEEPPRPWGFQPMREDFDKEHAESWDHMPIDDFVERWTGRLPEKKKNSGTGTDTEHKIAYVAGPPRCQLEKRGHATSSIGWAHAAWWNPLALGWIRVRGNGLVCEVIGQGKRPGYLKIRWPGGAVEEYDRGDIEPAYPRKDEWWIQDRCAKCAAAACELLFMADGVLSAHKRVDHGCLRPLNHGQGRRRP